MPYIFWICFTYQRNNKIAHALFLPFLHSEGNCKLKIQIAKIGLKMLKALGHCVTSIFLWFQRYKYYRVNSFIFVDIKQSHKALFFASSDLTIMNFIIIFFKSVFSMLVFRWLQPKSWVPYLWNSALCRGKSGLFFFCSFYYRFLCILSALI